ncbi:hypothetical protein Tco_0507222 [Tanacetum coccineum]
MFDGSTYCVEDSAEIVDGANGLTNSLSLNIALVSSAACEVVGMLGFTEDEFDGECAEATVVLDAFGV